MATARKSLTDHVANRECGPEVSRLVEQGRVVHEDVQNVQRQPADAEDERDADQEQVRSMGARFVLRLALGQLRLGALEPETLLQLKVDLQVGNADHHDRHKVLDDEGEDRVQWPAVLDWPILHTHVHRNVG